MLNLVLFSVSILALATAFVLNLYVVRMAWRMARLLGLVAFLASVLIWAGVVEMVVGTY